MPPIERSIFVISHIDALNIRRGANHFPTLFFKLIHVGFNIFDTPICNEFVQLYCLLEIQSVIIRSFGFIVSPVFERHLTQYFDSKR